MTQNKKLVEHSLYVLEDRDAVRDEILSAAKRYCKTIAREGKHVQAFAFEGHASPDTLVPALETRANSALLSGPYSIIADYVMVTPTALGKGAERKPVSLVAFGNLLKENPLSLQDCFGIVVYSARSYSELTGDSPFQDLCMRSMDESLVGDLTPSVWYLPKTADATGDVMKLIDGLRYMHGFVSSIRGTSAQEMSTARSDLRTLSRESRFQLSELLKKEDVQKYLS